MGFEEHKNLTVHIEGWDIQIGGNVVEAVKEINFQELYLVMMDTDKEKFKILRLKDIRCQAN